MLTEGRGPRDEASRASMEAWIPSQPSCTTSTSEHDLGGEEEEAQFNNVKATSVSQMEGLLPRGWGGVGLKQHSAPAAPHDCADIAA